MNNLLFHWYENPDECLILIEPIFSKILTEMIKKRYGFNKNISKNLNINSKFYYQLKKNKPIRIKTLKRIINKLKLNYNKVNRHILGIGGSKFTFPINFPVNLNNVDISILIAAFMSDGHNESQHPHYANMGFLGNKIIQSARIIIKDIPYEFRNEHVRFHPILGRILLKLGVPYGCKSVINPDVPRFIYSKKEWMRQYLTQVFDDEGHAATKISRKIVFGRSVTVKNVPKEFSKFMELKKKVYFNNLPPKIKEIVLETPQRLLVSEKKMLNLFGINSSLRCRGICKYIKRTSADWVIEISGKENIRKFHNNIGFSHPEKVRKMEFYLE